MKTLSIIMCLLSILIITSCNKNLPETSDYEVLWISENNSNGELIARGEKVTVYDDLCLIPWDYQGSCKDQSNAIVAYDKFSGKELWIHESVLGCGVMTQGRDNMVNGQYFAKTYLGDASEEFALEANTGKPVFSRSVTSNVRGSQLVVDGPEIYFLKDGIKICLAKYNAETKQISDLFSLEGKIQNYNTRGFNIIVGDDGLMDYLIASNTTAGNDFHSVLYRYSPEEDSILWNTFLGEEYFSPSKFLLGLSGVQLHEGKAYVCAEDLYCVNTRTGDLLWEKNLGGKMNKRNGLFFHDGFLFACDALNGNNNVHRIHPESGTVMESFSMDFAYEAPVIYDDYLIGSNGGIVVFRISTGEKLLDLLSEEIDSKFQLGFSTDVGVDPETGIIYANTFSHIVAIKPKFYK